MSVEIDQTDSCIGDESRSNKNPANDKSNSPDGFVYMDMDVYIEEDEEESSDNADVKEEAETRNSRVEFDESQCDENLLLNSVKNVDNNLIVGLNNDWKKANKNVTESIPLQRKNCSDEKGYRLRARTFTRKVDHLTSFKLENYKATRKKTRNLKKGSKVLNDESSIDYKCSTCDKHFSPYQPPGELWCETNGIETEKGFRYEKCKKCFYQKFEDSYSNCSRCQRSFESKENLKSHISKGKCKAAFNEHTCDICKETFTRVSTLRRHVSSHANDSLPQFEREKTDDGQKKVEYECDECGIKLNKLVKLKAHILNVHHGIGYRPGKRNRKSAPGRKESESRGIGSKTCKRKEVGDVEDPSKCKICGKSFSKRDYLKKHEHLHTNSLFKCKYCYCAFMKEKSYLRHVERMNCSKSARKIKMAEFNFRKCRICQIEYGTEESLICHFRECHPGEEPHRCFCCESILPTFKDLQAHIHHHNVKKYTCNLCGKPYTSQEGFRKHRLKHGGAEFKCRFCDSEFLNGGRHRFHEKSCKRNPESGFDSSKSSKKKKEERPKQSRQLHWESRIIMKRLRGDPKSGEAAGGEPPALANFFEETESEGTNERGWFDDYYKTEEDDVAFGLRKEENHGTGQDRKSDEESKKSQVEAAEDTAGGDAPAGDSSDVSDESQSNSSEEESVEEESELPIDYNPKKCRLCSITFDQEYELLHHFIKVHPEEWAHECPKCQVRSPLFARLKEHMKEHGIGIGIYNCDNCSKKFRSEKKMRNHNVRCRGVDPAEEDEKGVLRFRGERCKRCGKKFHTRFGYRRHKQTCKAKKKKTKKNDGGEKKAGAKEESAGDGFSRRLGKDDGMPENEGEKDGKPPPQEKKAEVKDGYAGDPPLDSFPCRLCEKKFQYERGIVMHFKSSHPGQKPLVCHVCSMHLADKLKEHLKTHGIGEEFVCELCGKRFNQKFLSKIHEMWHQGIEYKCGNCKQKFLNREKMEKHVGENRCRNRQSLMRLPCAICGKSYRSKFGLSKHHITHTPKELRPVKNRMNCEYCGKWFENNNGLQRHRRIHTGERPYCCRFCPKAFAQEGNCKAHERIHTGESKPRKKKQQQQQQPDPPQVLPLQQILLPVPPPIQQEVVQMILSPPAGTAAAVDSVPYPGHINLYVYNGIDPGGIVH